MKGPFWIEVVSESGHNREASVMPELFEDFAEARSHCRSIFEARFPDYKDKAEECAGGYNYIAVDKAKREVVVRSVLVNWNDDLD